MNDNTLPLDLVLQWHSTLNGTLDPTNFTKGSKKKVWWVCDKGHSYNAIIANRVNGSNCPYCTNRLILSGFNDLATVDPVLASQWHPTKNGDLTTDVVGAGSSKPAWWQCEKGHEWEAKIANRRAGSNCPYCTNRLLLSGFNDLATVNPTLASQWHPTKNGNLLPTEVSSGSGQKVWWLGECEHEWKTTVADRKKGRNCPFCGNQKILPGFNDLATVNPVLASQWHPALNGGQQITDVTLKSKSKVWWLGTCGHEWESTILSRLNRFECPICENSKISKKHTVSPIVQPFPSFNQTFVSTKKGGKKAKKEIFKYLTNLNVKVEKNNKTIFKGLEISLYVPDKRIAIEFNSLYLDSETQGKGRTYHYNKWLVCDIQGIQLIQIWEDDWNKDKEIIKNMLAHKLGVSTQPKIFARKTEIVNLTTEQAKIFLNINHIQGFASGTYYLGLQEKGTTEVVSLVVLKKEAGTDGKTLNIIRYATNRNVVGGFTKLLKYAETKYAPQRFITFADHCVSDGGLYKNNGFVADKILRSDYMYTVNGIRKHKFGYRLKKFKNEPTLLWEEGLTERELAKLNNLPRIWDAGKTRWVKNIADNIEDKENKQR